MPEWVRTTHVQGINATALREIKLLKELPHENVIRLIEAFPHKRHLSLVRPVARPCTRAGVKADAGKP